jgi:hypothetical protein
LQASPFTRKFWVKQQLPTTILFEFFLGPFFVVLFNAWMGEKVVHRLWKKKEECLGLFLEKSL